MNRIPSTLAVFAGLLASHAIVSPLAHGQWRSSSGHIDYVPHTETHYHTWRHGDHYHVEPHTTTHYDPVWHDTSGRYSGGTVYRNEGVVYPSESNYRIVERPSVVSSSPTVVSSSPVITTSSSPTIVESTVISNKIPSSSSSNTIPSSVKGSSAGSNRTITLINPVENGGPVKYKVNSFSYTINPGDSQTLKMDRDWKINFDNGRGKQLSHRLEEGEYHFSVDESSGWVLARIKEDDAPPPPTKSASKN